MSNLVPMLNFPPPEQTVSTMLSLAFGNHPPDPPAKKFIYDWPRPSLTADSVVFNGADVLLIRRGKEPFKGSLALPGGFVNEGETSRDAAVRELREETGLIIEHRPKLIGIYDRPGRDPRGWVVSHAFHVRTKQTNVTGMDDAIDAAWFQINKLKKSDLAFDHWTMINDAWDLERTFI